MEFLPLKQKLKNSGQVTKKGTKLVKSGKIKKASGKKVSKKQKEGEKSINKKANEIKENSSSQDEKTNYQKSRLFVFMKKKIVNETMVKELHPDIVSVRFPRKKRSRWCWAVFESEKKAQVALKQLKSKKDVIVRESSTKRKEDSLSKKKHSEINSKKAMKKVLKESWS